MIVTYVGYKLAMSPYGIQFSDDEDKLTMETLEKHDFEQGDKFVLYQDTEGKVCPTCPLTRASASLIALRL